MAPDSTALTLPVVVVGLIDVGRLIRELDKLESNVQQQTIKAEQGAEIQLPKFSLLLDQFVEQNKLDMRNEGDRKRAHEFLRDVRQTAPKVHMSFSANPSAQFLQKLTFWMRQNIHPQVLIAIGLQPGIGAGSVLRTTNKYFDMSLVKSFADSRGILMEYLHGPEASAGQNEVVAPPTEPVASPTEGAAV